jgi:hypothetical protein
MRFAILAAAGVAALLTASCAGPKVPEGPWCAVADQGGGNVTYNCRLPSFEACQREVLAGNRGQCSRNPRWKGPG